MPLLGVEGATAVVALQVGYSIADIAAKCGYGVLIYNIARAKMADEEAKGGNVQADSLSISAK